MTNYELMFIINPTLEEEKKNAVVEKVTEIITNGGGEVSKTDVWGMRKLAYPIEKKEEGPERAGYCLDVIMPAMTELRTPVDALEMVVDKEMWPMPSYGDLMFIL